MSTEQHPHPGTAPEAKEQPQEPPRPFMQAPAWLPPPAYLDELREAAKRNEASFPQMFMARLLARDQRFGPQVNFEVAGLIPLLLAGFQSRYGNIIDSRYGSSCAAGAVLLERIDSSRPQPVQAGGWRAWLAWIGRGGAAATAPPDPQDRTPRAGDLDAFVWWQLLHFDSHDASELLADTLSLRDRIASFLPDPVERESDARDIAVRRLYGIASELTDSIEAEEQHWLDDLTVRWYEAADKPVKHTVAGMAPSQVISDPQEQWEIYAFREQNKDQRPTPRFVRGIESLRARLANEETVYLAAVQRVAQHAYLDGMFKGFACLLLLLVALAVATGVIGFDAGWLATATLGATGAVLSVLQRMGRGLDLGPEGEKQSFKQQGWVRPAIGALLGIASFVLLKGGLVSLTTPPGSADKILYFGGIAFLAGFSERFAQDMLVAPAAANASRAKAPPPAKPR